MSQNGSINLGAVGMQIREAAITEERARLRPLLDEAIENLAEAAILEDGRGTREAVVRVDLLGADLDRIFGKG